MLVRLFVIVILLKFQWKQGFTAHCSWSNSLAILMLKSNSDTSCDTFSFYHFVAKGFRSLKCSVTNFLNIKHGWKLFLFGSNRRNSPIFLIFFSWLVIKVAIVSLLRRHTVLISGNWWQSIFFQRKNDKRAEIATYLYLTDKTWSRTNPNGFIRISLRQNEYIIAWRKPHLYR